MPFEIVRNNIVHMQVDAIVNTANPEPIVGAGTDAGIHAKAGPRLLEAREKIGKIRVGDAAITPGFDLDAKYVIHTVGPVWQNGQQGEEDLLRKCYTSSLQLAEAAGCHSVAFPLISAGAYGFPKDRALQAAIGAISAFLMQHEMQVYLVVFHDEAFRLSEKLFPKVASYIDAYYVEEVHREEYGSQWRGGRLRDARRRARAEAEADLMRQERCMPTFDACVSMKALLAAEEKAPPNMGQLVLELDATFSETLLELVKASGKKPSEIYTRANVSKQHYSKIINNRHHQPKKTTAVAFAIAFEMDLQQTQEFIGRAGYILTNNSKFDLIIKYFIQKKHYDINDINITLFDYDQMLLGA